MTAPATTARLELTGHPLQRCGAWAVTLLAERKHPDEVNTDDLDSVAGRLVDDVVQAATAAKDEAAYDWWKVLFALYPNSKATHSSRPKDAEALRRRRSPYWQIHRARHLPGAIATWA